jgi:uroporphyrinogen-III decarboxylase
MPAFYHLHTGVTYGEAYYFDPGHRAEIERVEGRLQHDLWGRYEVGSPSPEPSPCLSIQTVDLILGTQGAQWRFPVDATLESWGEPWAGLSIAEIEALDPQAAAHHPIIERVIAHYRELQKLYGERADVLGIKSGVMGIHTPYTTAHQLRGQDLFIEMMVDPTAARVIFAKVWEIYQAIFGRLAELLQVKLTGLHLGDCSAALLSEPVYREVVLPVNQALAAEFATVGYHSCGSSSHLLADFARLPHLASIQLGPGTDLAAAAQTLPGVHLMPLIDPLPLRNDSPAAVAEMIREVLAATAPAPQVTLCVWSLDRDTHPDNVTALYETVKQTPGN